MKKTQKAEFRKLHLAKEAIRTLQDFQLPQVVGGVTASETLKCTSDSNPDTFTCPATDRCLPGTL